MKKILIFVVSSFIVFDLHSGPSEDEMLLLAALDGNLQKVKIALSQGADIEAKDPLVKQTPLMWATQNNHYNIVKYLIENGASVDNGNEINFNALMLAATKGNTKICSYLLDHGAWVHHKTAKGINALMFAAWLGNVDTVKLLVDRGADKSDTDNEGLTPLDYAKSTKRINVIKYFEYLERQAANKIKEEERLAENKKIAEERSAAEGERINRFFQKCVDGTADEIATEVKYKPLVKAANSNGETALMISIENHRELDVISSLIKAGSSLTATNDRGETPLMIAINFNANTSIIKLLIKSGSSLKTSDLESKNILMASIEHNYDLEFIKTVVKAGIDVNSRNQHGLTPLMYACKYSDDLEVVKYLLKLGAKVNETDSSGNTPLIYALKRNTTKIYDILVESGADLTVKDSDGKYVTQYLAELNMKTYKIRDKGPSGGFVFYDKGEYTNGWRYLEAAPEDQDTGVTWCKSESSYLGTKEDVGYGSENTQKIISEFGMGLFNSYATRVCIEYSGGNKNDWFLPSVNELNLMYTVLKLRGFGNFAEEAYWSSTDINSAGAYYIGFKSGIRGSASKSKNKLFVRACRAF